MKNVLLVEVDDSLYLPDMFTIHMLDPDLTALHQDVFKLGSVVKISVVTRQPPDVTASPAPVVLMTGEITSIEPDLNGVQRTTLTIRGFDRSHKMNRVRKTQTFLQQSDGDVIRKLAQGAGLQAQVESTPVVYPYLMQANQTDWEFVVERAARLGYRAFVEDKTLHFKPPPSSPPETQLDWGNDFNIFRARLSTVEQASEVKVYGWDPKGKRAIVGQASSPSSGVQFRKDNGSSGGQSAQSAHTVQGKVAVTHIPVYNQAEADKIAKAVLDGKEGNFVRAEGETGGNPAIMAGSALQIKGVGPRFGGKYLVNRAIHRYDHKGYVVRFWCSGGKETMSLSNLLQAGGSNGNSAAPQGSSHNADKPTAIGVMVGIVTNNQDPENLGRVKVKFPMLPGASGDTESWWCRLVTPMAGPTRGIAFFPEADDEVVVAFLNGDPNHGYVIGAVWNGTDKLPKPLSKLVTGGQTLRRVMRTRVGHEIMFDDTGEPTRGITLIDKTEKDFIKIITAPDDKIIIECQKDVQITAQTGDVSVEAKTAKISVKSMGNTDVQSSTGNISLKAAAGKVSIEGTAGVDITSPAITNIKGSMVNIN
jgi:uncharacterized protein involved in type VI secretion and phage assembly